MKITDTTEMYFVLQFSNNDYAHPHLMFLYVAQLSQGSNGMTLEPN